MAETSEKDEHVAKYLVDPMDDASLDDLLGNYEKLHTKEAQYAMMDEQVESHDFFYNMTKNHLSSHNGEEETNRSYKNLSIKGEKANDTEKKHAVRDLVNKWALAGIAKQRGTSIEELLQHYANHQGQLHKEIKQHVKEYMATERLNDYDAIVEYLLSVEHVPFAMKNDDVLKELMDTYVQKTSSHREKMESHIQEILKRVTTDADSWKQFKKYTNKKLEPHGLELHEAPNAQKLAAVLQRTMPQLYNPEFFGEVQKGKHLKEKPSED